MRSSSGVCMWAKPHGWATPKLVSCCVCSCSPRLVDQARISVSIYTAARLLLRAHADRTLQCMTPITLYWLPVLYRARSVSSQLEYREEHDYPLTGRNQPSHPSRVIGDKLARGDFLHRYPTTRSHPTKGQFRHLPAQHLHSSFSILRLRPAQSTPGDRLKIVHNRTISAWQQPNDWPQSGLCLK